VALRIDYRKLRTPRFVYGAAIVTTLLLILVLFLKPVNETHRWIRLGALSFQPAELAKLSLILFLATHLERRGERVNEFFTSLFPALLLLGWFAFLVFVQPDLGSAAILVITAAVMLFMAGVRLRYFAALAVPAGALLYFAVTGAHYRWARIVTFFNPWADARGSGYQIIQSMIAVGTGGISGVGFMEGRQKQFYLPYPYSDFIYAVIGEELGVLGALAPPSRRPTPSACSWPRASPWPSWCRPSSTSAWSWASFPPREYPCPSSAREARPCSSRSCPWA
jgi:cell division protein FtsW